MRRDGLRRVLLVAVGLPVAVVGVMELIGSSPSRNPAVGVVLGGGGAVLVWLAGSDRPVGRVGWLITTAVGLVTLGLSIVVRREYQPWPVVGGHAIFWWFAAVLLVLPINQAVRALHRARRRLLLLDHIGSRWWPVWVVQRFMELFSARAGDYMTRRQVPLLAPAGLRVVESQRLKWGTVERVAATKPAS